MKYSIIARKVKDFQNVLTSIAVQIKILTSINTQFLFYYPLVWMHRFMVLNEANHRNKFMRKIPDALFIK